MCAGAQLHDSNAAFGGTWDCCPRRQTWLAQYASRCSSVLNSRTSFGHSFTDRRTAEVQAIRDFVMGHQRVLWWIDGADVACTRAIAEITQRSHGTIHVGQATGATLVKRTMINEGWLGTTLGEVSGHADLVITLGDCILSEAPLLPARFLSRPDGERPLEWWHVSANHIENSNFSPTTPLPAQSLVWPRAQWLQRLTALQLELQFPANNGPDSQTTGQESLLAEALRRSRYAVWIWDNSEFTNSIDELVISRLLGIARQRTETARCALLNLESQVGQLTAEETLLWLTGCSGTATWNGAEWTTPPRYAAYSLDDWQTEFEAIALVRTVPSVAPLPQLRAELIVATAAELAEKATDARQSSGYSIVVQPTGYAAAGHLQRGDRGASLLVGAPPSRLDREETPADWSAGCELFAEVAGALPSRALATPDATRQGAG